MNKAYPFFRIIRKSVVYLLIVSITTLFLLEIVYRTYLFDFYKGNLQGLNETAVIESSDLPTLLALGDSFTADKQSYLNYLRSNLSHYRIINSAVPGTTVRQHALMASKRLRQFDPDIFIYQIYVGNDLFEYDHPIGSRDISVARKIYWWISDRISVIAFINAKLPSIRQAIFHDLPIKMDPKLLEDFSQEKYSMRSKLMFRAEASIIENSVLLKGNQKSCLGSYTNSIRKITDQLPKKCKVVFLVIPHCMQLGSPYLERMQTIGANVTDPLSLTSVDYPFYNYLKTSLGRDNVYFINTLEWLKKQDKITPVYYNNDPHLNNEGHMLIGKKMIEFLKKEGILEHSN